MEQNTAIKYEYRILRYRHDAVTGEFANLGIVFYDAEAKFLRAKFVKKYGRLSKFFGEIGGKNLLTVLKSMRTEFNTIGARLNKELPLKVFADVGQITDAVLPKDDNALFFSETFKGWHIDREVAFAEIYERIIKRYQEEKTDRENDAYAWKHVYKKYFEAQGIAEKLHPQTVKTDFTSIEFDKTVQNGSLHCFQSLTFALKHDHSIEEKVYRWDGKIRELATTDTPVELYLLSVLPEDAKLSAMIKSKLNQNIKNCNVTVISEGEAARVAQRVKGLLEEH